MKLTIKLLFLTFALLMSTYIVMVESERYESSSIALLKDLENKQKVNLSDVLLGQSSSTMQDSKVLELYVRSSEMFTYLDKENNLTKYYSSEKLDFVQRLYRDSVLPLWKLNHKNLLTQYNKDLLVNYDDPSGTLELTFIHTDPQKAQKILKEIIAKSEDVINDFAKENARIALAFIEAQREKKRQLFVEAIKKLIEYQNKHHTIDPNLDVERKMAILSDLELELIKSEVEYATKLKTFNPNSRELKMIKENIRNIRKSIEHVKKSLSGNSSLTELNTNVFDFQLLKNDMEFAKEVYRQTLINQEEIKIEVAQQSKHLAVVVHPNLADDYTYPNKLWDIFTMLLLLILVYSIVMAVVSIIQNHKD